MINLIYASDLDGGIGKNNRLPWNKPQDLKRFKEITDGSIIVMGSSTWQSLPFKLPNRINVVLGSNVDTEYKKPDIILSLLCLKTLQAQYPSKDIFIIGGEQTYKRIVHLCDTIYHTEIEDIYVCDTFFDHHEFGEYKLESEEYLGNNCTIKIWKRSTK